MSAPLTEPVGIGVPSQTIFEWYGSESACSGAAMDYCRGDVGQLLRGAGVASAGRFLERPLFAGRRSEAAMTLELRNVLKRLPRILAVDKVRFSAPACEITGYVAHYYA